MSPMLDYDTTMSIGRTAYQDVLDQLQDAGFGAAFTQTGGMNAALEVMLDGGYTLLITDGEDSLSWDRQEHRGWGVGLYPPDQANTGGECMAFCSTSDGSVPALLVLADQVLRDYVRRPDAERT